MLQGRRRECAVLERLLEVTQLGQSAALVVRGEAGIGKTALLEYAAERAGGCRVLRAVGVESEMELPFAGLHQLCMPLLDGLERLPTPQQDALGTAFGLTSGARPDRFLVGLAVLSLLSDATEEQPLLCLIDDAQWLDQSSAQVLAFVARRLKAESIVLVFAERDPGGLDAFTGLSQLRLEGLSEAHAGELLASVVRGPLDERVAGRIVAETRGNPLAVLELPHGLSPAELAGGFAPTAVLPLPGRIEESFRQRAERLPADSQHLLLVAAAEPIGDPTLLWRAAERLGLGPEAADPAEAAGLLTLGARVTFRHPLLRSAIYRAASAEKRRSAHEALAGATDPEFDPDRRAWHRAQATLAPDEEVAAELERSADRARARGGSPPQRRFSSELRALTPDPAQRARARANRRSGDPRVGCARGGSQSCWRPRKGGRWTCCSAPASSGCARSSHSPRDADGMLHRCCSMQQDTSSRWTPSWHVRHISKRSPRRSSPAVSVAGAVCGKWQRRPVPRRPRRRRGRSTCSSTAWRLASPTDMRRACHP